MTVAYEAIRLACRTRLLDLVVCTTGTLDDLSVTATGFTRASGSFLDDGFAPGMELRASGFAGDTDGLALVRHVSATELAVDAYRLDTGRTWARHDRTLTPDGTGPGRSLTVGLPTLRAWEGLHAEPIDGVPWLEESLVYGPTGRPGFLGSGSIVADPMYQIVLHQLADRGIGATDRLVSALLRAFAPGQGLSLPHGRVVRIRTDTGPYTARLGRLRPGFLTTSVTFPLRTYTPQPVT